MKSPNIQTALSPAHVKLAEETCAVASREYRLNPKVCLTVEESQLFAKIFDAAKQPYPARLSQHIRAIDAAMAFGHMPEHLSQPERLVICREFFDAAEAYLPGTLEQVVQEFHPQALVVLGEVTQ